MKNNKIIHSVTVNSAVIILFLLLILLTALTATADSTPLTINETRITTSGSADSPVISGDRIVWADGRNGNSDIYMYDITTGTETQITTNGSNQMNPATYGDKIVWADNRNGNSDLWNYDIYMYDITTSIETPIATGKSKQLSPSIYGNRIVWMDDRNGNSDIYMYDITTGKETQITTDGSWQGFPVIYGSRIVWQDIRTGDYDIYMYNLMTSKEIPIAFGASTQTSPDIYVDRIVWMDDLNGNYDIYMYDLSTSKKTQISTIGTSQENPAIYNDRIVWMDDRKEAGIYDIYMYDITTGKETQITTDGSNHVYPDIYSDNVVWYDSRNGGNEIYMGTVLREETKPQLPAANFSINVTTGYVPLTVQFTDLSENSTSRNWDFENDGNTDSTEESPIHVYTNPGTYTVNLTASNSNGTSSKTATINVLEQPVAPVASFSASPTTGKAPLIVTFTDSSTGSPKSWYWDFGDKGISTDQYPVHTYSKAGKYTVSLTVENTVGNNTKTISRYITVESNSKKK